MGANDLQDGPLQLSEPVSLQQWAELQFLNSLLNNPEAYKQNEHWIKTKAEEITFARVMSEFSVEHKEALSVINGSIEIHGASKSDIKRIKAQSVITAENMAVKNNIKKVCDLATAWRDSHSKE